MSLEGALPQQMGEFLFLAKSLNSSPKLVTTFQSTGLLSPMVVFGSCLLSSAAEKLPPTLVKERRSWSGAEHPPELEGKLLRCPGCIGPVTPAATRPAAGLLGSHGNMDTSLGA